MKKIIILLLAALLLATPLGAETWVNGVPQFNNADINNPDIDGGTIDGTTIGGTTPAAGTFTDLAGNVAVVTHNATEGTTAPYMKGQIHVVTGAYTISIPTIAIGHQADFIASTAAVMCVDVTTGTDILILNGTALTAGNKACTDGSINAQFRLKCPIAGKCTINSIVGLAVDGGA